MKSNLKNTKYQTQNTQCGITLVALIITVIILLILATVSIKLIMNEGIIGKAEKGTASYSSEEELEQIKLAVASAKLAGNGFLTAENLNIELQKVFNNTETVSENSNSFKYKSNKTYTINKDGSVGEYKSILPSNYQEVEYIESTGTQYIDTKSNSSSNITIITKALMQNNTKGQYLFGEGINGRYVNIGLLVFSIEDEKTYKARLATGHSQSSNVTIESEVGIGNIPHLFKVGSKVGFFVDERQISNGVEYEYSDGDNIYVFGWNGHTSDLLCTSSKLYYLSILNKDSIIRNFIPCYSTTTVTDANGIQKPANTKGLYDTVEGKFYTNQGNGDDFIAGPNV